MKNWLNRNKKLLSYVAVACAIIAFYTLVTNTDYISAALDKVGSVLSPFVFGAIIAYLLRPCCNLVAKLLNHFKFMKKHFKLVKTISVTCAIVWGLLLVTLFCMAIIPELINSVTSIVQTLPETSKNVAGYIQKWAEKNPTVQTVLSELYTRAISGLKTELTPNVTSIVNVMTTSANGIFDFVKTIFIGVIVAVYLLSDKSRLKVKMLSLIDRCFKPSTSAAIKSELAFADKTFTRYVNGTCMDALLVGVVTYIFCLITGMPSPMLMATTIAVTNIIPIVGPFIGAIPTALIVLAYSPEKCLIYCIYLLILQQLDGHILVPKILGQAVGISGLTALFAITVGGGLFGIPGMILGVPFVTVLLDIVHKLVERKSKHDTPTTNEKEE